MIVDRQTDTDRYNNMILTNTSLSTCILAEQERLVIDRLVINTQPVSDTVKQCWKG